MNLFQLILCFLRDISLRSGLSHLSQAVFVSGMNLNGVRMDKKSPPLIWKEVEHRTRETISYFAAQVLLHDGKYLG